MDEKGKHKMEDFKLKIKFYNKPKEFKKINYILKKEEKLL
jgi:hypothetical protein